MKPTPYPAYRKRLIEEIGDGLWYLARLSAVLDPSMMQDLDKRAQAMSQQSGDSLTEAVTLGVAAGQLLGALENHDEIDAIREAPANLGCTVQGHRRIRHRASRGRSNESP